MTGDRTASDRTADDVAAVLASIPMFRHLGARQRRRLARHCCRRTYRAGDVIVRQGDTSMSFYVVLSGAVRILRHGNDGDGGGAAIIDEGPGSFFGEMGVLDDLPRAATVVALDTTECALLAKWDFQRELGADPGIALALISVLNARIRALEDGRPAPAATASTPTRPGG